MKTSLTLFHPLLQKWFREQIGEPTEVQERSWPVIAANEHVLVTAPTGSGKTLTAFLWAINQGLSHAWQPGGTKVLYVSPLKALNNDIRRNLSDPLTQLQGYFERAQEPFPALSVMTRSGDTPQLERARMIRRPPDILITTPESLNLLVSSPRGQSLLSGLQTVILDEIHSVVNTRRGRIMPNSGIRSSVVCRWSPW